MTNLRKTIHTWCNVLSLWIAKFFNHFFFGQENASQLEEYETALNITGYMPMWPITVASPSKAWTVFAYSNAGIVRSNPTEGMDVCVYVYTVFVLSCV
jgi:hypothetical protein